MKQRLGFVSNSSSSSFVVVFPKELPKTVEEMEELLFGDALYAGYDGEHTFSTKEIAAHVLRDMEDGPIKRRIELIDNLRNGELSCSGLAIKHGLGASACPRPDFMHLWDKPEDEKQKIIEDYSKAKNDFAETIAKKLLKFAKMSQLYRFTYSDNDGSELFAFMEHGDIFRRLVHYRLNQH